MTAVTAKAAKPAINRHKIDAAASKQKLLPACAHLSPWVFHDFFAALIAYVDAYESYASRSERAPKGMGFTHANEPVVALWTGLRASLAVFFVSSFWIISDWPHGSTIIKINISNRKNLLTWDREMA